MPFRFRLERVLGFRREREEDARRYMVRCEEELRRADFELKATTRSLERTWEAGCHDPRDALHLAYYRDFLRRLKESQEQKLRAAETKVREAREALLVARRERRILERLREKYYAAYLAEEAAREARSLDELGVYGFHRRRERR